MRERTPDATPREPARPPRWTEGGAPPSLQPLLRALPDASPPPGARERVWRQLSHRKSRIQATTWLVPAAATAALATALVVFFVMNDERAPGVAAPRFASVTVLGDDPAKAGAHLDLRAHAVPSGARVETSEEEDALIALASASVALGKATSVEVARAPEGAGLRVRLARGKLLASVRKRAPADAFVVQAGDVRVRVIGTLFTVARDGDGHVEVEVAEGVVSVEDGGRESRVAAGQHWTNAATAAPLPSPTPPSAPSAALPADLEPRAVEVERDGPIAEPSAEEGDAVDDGALEGPVEVPSEEVPRLASPSTRARDLAHEGDFAAAARLYEEAARTEDASAELSLYEAARLRRRYLRDDRGAARLYLEYLARFPSGRLAPEAEVSLLECQVRLGETGRALRTASQFLQRHPESERRGEVRLLRAHLWREAGDCARALDEYARLAGQRGFVGDDASYFATYCEKALGRIEAARRRAASYLRRFPHGRHRDEAARALAND